MRHDPMEAVEDAEQGRVMPSARGAGGFATGGTIPARPVGVLGDAPVADPFASLRRRHDHPAGGLIRPQPWPLTPPASPADDSLFDDLGLQPAPEAPKPASAFDRQEGGSHYKRFAIQPAEFLMANGVPWAEGSAIQYVLRWREKGGLADLRKAIHTLEMLIEHEERKGVKP